MIKIDYNAIGKFISKRDWWEKQLQDFDKGDLRIFAEAILDATSLKDGFEAPRLEGNNLIIPFRAPLKYRWWQGGQSIYDTLTELGASDDVKAIHTQTGRNEGMPKNRINRSCTTTDAEKKDR